MQYFLICPNNHNIRAPTDRCKFCNKLEFLRCTIPPFFYFLLWEFLSLFELIILDQKFSKALCIAIQIIRSLRSHAELFMHFLEGEASQNLASWSEGFLLGILMRPTPFSWICVLIPVPSPRAMLIFFIARESLSSKGFLLVHLSFIHFSM